VSTAVLRATGVENFDLYETRRNPRFQEVSVRPLSDDQYEISFQHEYPAVARLTTQQFVSAALNRSAQTRRFREAAWRDMSWSGAPPASDVEVISGASDPRKSGPPVRVGVVGVGLFAGLVLAAGIRRPKLAWGIGVLALVGWLVVMAWPRRYTATAEFRVVGPLNPAVWYAPTTPERLASHVARLRGLQPVQIAATLLGPDLRIELLPPTSFRVSVTARDPATAQSTVRQLVSTFVESDVKEQWRYADKQAGAIYDMAAHNIGERLELIQAAHIAKP
jgi:hypothetical protein